MLRFAMGAGALVCGVACGVAAALAQGRRPKEAAPNALLLVAGALSAAAGVTLMMGGCP